MEVNYMECIENHKEYKNIDEQIRYLYDSKKIVVDKEDEHWFVDVNYITLINPYKEIFATGKDENGNHVYGEYTNFKEFLKIMEIELKFTDVLYKSIRDFERKFKNVIFSILCKNYVEEKKDIYCTNYALEIETFLNVFNSNEEKVDDKYFPLFCSNMYNTLKKTGYVENDYGFLAKIDLIKKMYSIGTGKEIDGYKTDVSNRLVTHFTSKNIIAPLWVIPNALTLGEISILFSMLDESLQNEIYTIMENKSLKLQSGEYEYKKLSKFSGRLEYIRAMRNTINHYEPILPLFVNTINNQAKAIKNSKVYSALNELNKNWTYEQVKTQNFETSLDINTNLTTYNIPKIRLLEMMESYSNCFKSK